MHRLPEYILLFIALALLQSFLLNNLNLGLYVHPLVYVAFITLLPMEMKSGWVLMAGLAMGLSVDLLVAGDGLHTIASLLTAFCRRGVLTLMIGKETIDDGGAPCAARIGVGRFTRYAAVLALLHCAAFFLFEAFGLSWLQITTIRIVLSAAATLFLTFIIQLFFTK